MVYIRDYKLPKLKEYKYSGVDHSLVSKYVLKPFYTNFVIHLFPMSMAPNLITLSGFGFVIINFLTLLWYNPTLDQDCPDWVYYSWAVGLFLYQTFDAVDGSQARRTKQSGPLGELFDHGVDALNTTLETIIFCATMNYGQGWSVLLVQFAALLTFYVQTWDEYHTHTLTLGIISGPVEGVLTMCIVYAVTPLLGGGSFWAKSPLQQLGIKNNAAIPDAIYNLGWREWWLVYGAVVLVFNTVSSINSVFQARRARGQRTRVALLGLLPFLAAWTLIPLYLYLQPLILHNHLVPFTFLVGIINAYSVGQMIVAHLTKTKFPMGNVLVLPFVAAVADSLGPVLSAKTNGLIGWPSALGSDVYQVAFVFCSLGLAIGVYGSFVVDVIYTICDYLDIWCLKIKHPMVNPLEKKIADDKAKGIVDTNGHAAEGKKAR